MGLSAVLGLRMGLLEQRETARLSARSAASWTAPYPPGASKTASKLSIAERFAPAGWMAETSYTLTKAELIDASPLFAGLSEAGRSRIGESLVALLAWEIVFALPSQLCCTKRNIKRRFRYSP